MSAVVAARIATAMVMSLTTQGTIMIMGGIGAAGGTVVIMGGVRAVGPPAAHAVPKFRRRNLGGLLRNLPALSAMGVGGIGTAHRAGVVMGGIRAARRAIVAMGRISAVRKVTAHTGKVHQFYRGRSLRPRIGLRHLGRKPGNKRRRAQ